MGAQGYEGLVSLYHGIFLYCGIAAILFLAATILLFIFLRIPRVFFELTGRAAKKTIAQMSKAGAASGNRNTSRRLGDDGRRHRKSRTGALGTLKLRRKSGSLSGGLTTEKMVRSGGMGGAYEELEGMMPGTPAAENIRNPAAVNIGTSPSGGFTGNGYATDDSGAAPTDILSFGPAMAQGPDSMPGQIMTDGTGDFVVLRTIMEIHTDEVI